MENYYFFFILILFKYPDFSDKKITIINTNEVTETNPKSKTDPINPVKNSIVKSLIFIIAVAFLIHAISLFKSTSRFP